MVFPPLIECAGAGHFGAILNQVDMHDNVIARLDRAIQCPQSDGYRITRSSRAMTPMGNGSASAVYAAFGVAQCRQITIFRLNSLSCESALSGLAREAFESRCYLRMKAHRPVIEPL